MENDPQLILYAEIWGGACIIAISLLIGYLWLKRKDLDITFKKIL
jgi:hypothetical protein